mmetsp:Transcript_25070/g.46762  ORF Transcript_25070/g.46762 Transcript_25070/m.46762 type:complete len:84 (-) Transcript_25070:23-274(-)
MAGIAKKKNIQMGTLGCPVGSSLASLTLGSNLDLSEVGDLASTNSVPPVLTAPWVYPGKGNRNQQTKQCMTSPKHIPKNIPKV